jgi:hypothetical protein
MFTFLGEMSITANERRDTKQLNHFINLERALETVHISWRNEHNCK